MALEKPSYALVQTYVDTTDCNNAQDVVSVLNKIGTQNRVPKDYWKGDVESKEKERVKFCQDEPKACQATDTRDKKWVPRMIEISNKYEQPFFAFGALHLFGANGLIKLLEAKGYKIKRILSENDEDTYMDPTR